jgi:hypothetical protein
MPQVTVTIPNIQVNLDVPADFAAYITLDDLREMAQSILSVEHTGLGVDTICRIRAGEKCHEWTQAFVTLDEDEPINVNIEDDGFAALEKQIADTEHGHLSLTIAYRKLGQQTELMAISNDEITPPEADAAMPNFMRQLEAWWKSVMGELR